MRNCDQQQETINDWSQLQEVTSFCRRGPLGILSYIDDPWTLLLEVTLTTLNHKSMY